MLFSTPSPTQVIAHASAYSGDVLTWTLFEWAGLPQAATASKAAAAAKAPNM